MSNHPTPSDPRSGVRRIHADIFVPARGEPQQVNDLVIESGIIHTVEVTNNNIPQGVQRLALNPLANAHDHGRPHSPAYFGAQDQPLEYWLPGLVTMPALDVYTTTAASLCQAARGGVSSVVHVHDPYDMTDVVAEASAVMHAVDDVGLRMGLVVPIMDQVHSVYGSTTDLMARVPQQLAASVVQRWGSPPPLLVEQLASFEAIAAMAPPLVDVQLGPIGPQWCTDEALRSVANLSAAGEYRVHMHLLESKRQREWADAAFPNGLLSYLDRIGLLSPRLAVAHGVWLNPAELDLLANRGVSVVTNTSSNIRLRSGVARLATMVDAGVDLALGIDSMPLYEPGDMFKEWDLARTIHHADEHEPLDQAMRYGVTVHGHILAGREGGGDVKDCAVADVAVASWDPNRDGPIDTDAVWRELRRRGGQGLDELYVAGRLVVEGGELITVDEDDILVELDALIEQWKQSRSDDSELVEGYRNAIRRFYADGCHLHGPVMTSMTEQ